MRLIDADEASATLKELLYETAMNNDGQFSDACVEIAENRVEIWVGLVPTVDPVKHGWWIYYGDETIEDGGRCSVCGGDQPAQWVNKKWQYLETKYCPNCGAKMDGDEE